VRRSGGLSKPRTSCGHRDMSSVIANQIEARLYVSAAFSGG
jgi:hypothetical protein